MRVQGRLIPAQARSFLTFPFDVAYGAGTLRIALKYSPARVGKLRNLLTLTVFDPSGFRGAAHRHDPNQTVRISQAEASPGFLPGPLPRGRWAVELDLHAVLEGQAGQGVEYQLEIDVDGAPVTTDLDHALPKGEPVERGVPTEPTPAVQAGILGAPQRAVSHRWRKGDLHLHSNHSDGRWALRDVVEYASRNELDFIALTDHNTVSAQAELRARLRHAKLDTVVIPAMELTTFWGHANALGVHEWIDWRVRGTDGLPPEISPGQPAGSMEAAAQLVHDKGGIFVINHPLSQGYPYCTGCRWDMGDTSAEYADAIEVMNGPWQGVQNSGALELWNRWLNDGVRLPATAGSDSHGWAKYPEQLGYTYALADDTPQSILTAVKRGLTYLSRGPAIEWRSPLPGQAFERAADSVTFRFGNLRGAVDAVLVADGVRGKKHRVSREGEFAFSLEGAASAARWIRLEVYRKNTDEILALSNPAFRSA